MRTFITLAFLCATVALAAEPVNAGLLTPDFETQLKSWFGSKSLANFANIYTKAAGDDSADFHAAVDEGGQTVTLIEVQAAGSDVWQVIGGHNPQSWSSTGGLHLTPDNDDRFAFIFNLSTATRFDQKLRGKGTGRQGSGWPAGARTVIAAPLLYRWPDRCGSAPQTPVCLAG